MIHHIRGLYKIMTIHIVINSMFYVHISHLQYLYGLCDAATFYSDLSVKVLEFIHTKYSKLLSSVLLTGCHVFFDLKKEYIY